MQYTLHIHKEHAPSSATMPRSSSRHLLLWSKTTTLSTIADRSLVREHCGYD